MILSYSLEVIEQLNDFFGCRWFEKEEGLQAATILVTPRPLTVGY